MGFTKPGGASSPPPAPFPSPPPVADDGVAGFTRSWAYPISSGCSGNNAVVYTNSKTLVQCAAACTASSSCVGIEAKGWRNLGDDVNAVLDLCHLSNTCNAALLASYHNMALDWSEFLKEPGSDSPSNPIQGYSLYKHTWSVAGCTSRNELASVSSGVSVTVGGSWATGAEKEDEGPPKPGGGQRITFFVSLFRRRFEKKHVNSLCTILTFVD